jgi:hypothetical protein
MQNPRRDYRFHLHRDHFFRYIDPKTTIGLEIGAYDLPMIEPDEGSCEFADYRSTEELTALSATVPGHDSGFIADVKYDLKKGYVIIGRKFDWIVAAHVIEHIPDVIGWLKNLADLLIDRGLVFLIIPDKRFTYDFHRHETTVSEFVDAHRRRLTRPSFIQAFDHAFYSSKSVTADVIWSGGLPNPPRCDYTAAFEFASRAESEYVDTHCSTFTPDSFFVVMSHLCRENVIPFGVEEVRSTQGNQIDFSAFLRRK